MKNYDNYIGKVFGRLTIEKIIHENKKVKVECICICGNKKITDMYSVIGLKTKSCGCLNTEKQKESGKKFKKDLTNIRFCRLLVLGEAEKPENRKSSKHIFWKCKCDCGIIKTVCSNHLLSGDTKSCGCLHYESITGIPFEKRDNNLELFLPYLQNIKDRTTQYSKIKDKSINVTLQDLMDIWSLQQGKCPFLGIELILKRWKKDNSKNKCIYQASLDRIDNSKGYTKDNIQFVSLMINYAKNRYDDEQVFEFCKLISKHWKDKI